MLELKTNFQVDKSKCIQCGKCINTCSGLVLRWGEDGYPEMKPFDRFGWKGCWRCQHCLAVCPQGAISIFGKRPENSLPPVPEEMGVYMERLVTNRRSCRRFLDKNVDSAVITSILSLQNRQVDLPILANLFGLEGINPQISAAKSPIQC